MMQTRFRTLPIGRQMVLQVVLNVAVLVALPAATGLASSHADNERGTEEKKRESQEILDMTDQSRSSMAGIIPLAVFEDSRTSLARSGDGRFLIVTRETSDTRRIPADALAAIEYRGDDPANKHSSRASSVNAGTVVIHELNRTDGPPGKGLRLGDISRRDWERLEAELIDGVGNGFGPIVSLDPGRVRLTVPGPEGGRIDIHGADRNLFIDGGELKPFATSLDRISSIVYRTDSGRVVIRLELANENEEIAVGTVSSQAWSLLEAFFSEHPGLGIDNIRRE